MSRSTLKTIINYIQADWEIRFRYFPLWVRSVKNIDKGAKNTIAIAYTYIRTGQINENQLNKIGEIIKTSVEIEKDIVKIYKNVYAKYNLPLPKTILNHEKQLYILSPL
jgi:hypothetical protein